MKKRLIAASISLLLMIPLIPLSASSLFVASFYLVFWAIATGLAFRMSGATNEK